MKIDSPVLKRLGPVPFWRGEKKCLAEFNRLYKKAHTFALERLSGATKAEGIPRKRNLPLTAG